MNRTKLRYKSQGDRHQEAWGYILGHGVFLLRMVVATTLRGLISSLDGPFGLGHSSPTGEEYE